MEIYRSITAIQQWRKNKKQVVFIPTMGNLHAGHLALVRFARQHYPCASIVVSIFVNPLQFAPHEDFDSYPRTHDTDLEKLASLNIDCVFLPHAAELYPQGKEQHTQISVPSLARGLCATSRPHFFTGVATVVAKLFMIVQPTAAVFGEKDYQQLMVIKQMVIDLHLPIDILGHPIVREHSGLAMSSRNQYLSPTEQQQAAKLYQQLKQTQQRFEQDEHDFSKLCEQAINELTRQGFKVDYFEIRQQESLQPATQASQALIALTAAWLGKTRLIDNLQLRTS